MAAQTIKGGFQIALPYTAALPTFNALTIDAAGEKVAGIFRVPKSGTISKVGFRTVTVTTSQTLRVGLQTVSASTGDPTGSAYGSMVAGTQASPASDTAYAVTLGTPATATVDDVIAIVIEFDSTAGNLQLATIAGADRVGFPYTDWFTSSWTKASFNPLAYWVEYDDGSVEVIHSIYPFSAINSVSFASNSTPDERAMKFTLTFPSRLSSVELVTSVSAAFDLVLYEGTTALVTKSFDPDQVGTGSTCRWTVPFLSGTLAAGTAYYLAMKPTTTSTVNLNDFDVLTANIMDALDGGQAFHFASRTDAGAWSATTTKRPLMGLKFDQFSDGAGGGGGLAANPVRGFVT